jgi:predicted glutamine amidotransferase
MCGIAYAHNLKGLAVNNDIMQQFDAQRHRGVQGFGLFDGQENNMVRSTTEDKILKWLVKYDSNLILFHHRFPTSTINVKRAAHPFSTKDYFGNTQYVMVHNGHISNASSLRKEHEKLGIKYYSVLEDDTFNDSEALCWDLALTLEGKQDKLQAYGGIAFICLKIVDGALERMYFGRNSNPLSLRRGDGTIHLSSEGDGDAIERNTLYNYNYLANRLTTKKFTVPATYYDINPHYSSQYADSSYPKNGFKNSGFRGLPSSWNWGSEYSSDFMDYDRDGNPIYVDEYNSYDEFYARKHRGSTVTHVDERNLLSEEEIMEEMETFTPPITKVQSRVLDYLCEAQGNFETAYWMAELDYSELMEEEGTQESIQETMLVGAVMDAIESDPENINDKSISSTWEALWEDDNSIQSQMKLLTA